MASLLRAAWVVALIFGALAVGALGARGASAQPQQVAITAVDLGGRVMPFEQFRAEAHAGCPGDASSPPVPHLHTKSGGPAVAIDLTEVADPAPGGCGFGIVVQGAPNSAPIGLVNVDAAALARWTARTGIEVVSVSAAVPANAPATPTRPAATAPTTLLSSPERPPEDTSRLSTRARVLIVVPLTLLLGAGLAYYMTRHTEPVRASTWTPSTRVEMVEPTADGGLLSARLSRGHAGLLAAPDPQAVEVEPDAVDEPDAEGTPAVAVLDRTDDAGAHAPEDDGVGPGSPRDAD